MHFVDNSNYNANGPNRGKLYKVWGVVEFLVDQFKNVYKLTQHISIDEELLLWKGTLSFKQYIPSKHSRFGVKLLSLCENSGYLWNSFVYLGKNPGNDNENLELKNRIGKTGVILVSLAKDFFGLGFQLYVDNWYTSEALCNYLYEYQIISWVQFPKSFMNEKLKKVEFFFRRNENMLALGYEDKKVIYVACNA